MEKFAELLREEVEDRSGPAATFEEEVDASMDVMAEVRRLMAARAADDDDEGGTE